MMEYQKINSIFKRDQKGNFIESKYAQPEFELLKDMIWQLDEKVDGTNIRVMWDGERVTFGGRTDKAQIPANLINVLQEKFPAPKFIALDLPPMTLYGEGYGAKIQKGGGNYNSETCDFVMFDVRCSDLWLLRDNVLDIGAKLEVDVVPRVGSGTLTEAVRFTAEGFKSSWGDFQAEGLILRLEPILCNRFGNRIIAKVKCKDFRRKR